MILHQCIKDHNHVMFDLRVMNWTNNRLFWVNLWHFTLLTGLGTYALDKQMGNFGPIFVIYPPGGLKFRTEFELMTCDS